MRSKNLLSPSQEHLQRRFCQWMGLFTFLLLMMIFIGGVTRLTGSGLSIVEWKPITGLLPPFTLGDWQLLFQQYKTSPEFQKMNGSFSLDDFKSIFWLEYLHRLWGRLMGLVLLIPTFYALRYPFLRRHLPLILSLWIFGLLQGALGWYMVKSGLVKDPWVSPYRLTAHLILGLILYGMSLRLTLTASKNWSDQLLPFRRGIIPVRGLLALLGLTILWGGLVAGHKAGLIYNTFPLMNGVWFPEDLFFLKPLWRNFYENPTTVQWIHRSLAFLSLGGTLFLAWEGYRTTRSRLFLLWIGAAILQVTLGAITILYSVPVVWGSLHQVGAFLLWSLVFTGYTGLSIAKQKHEKEVLP